MMAYFTSKMTTATATGLQRRWVGEAKPATISAWMAKRGLVKCHVSVDGIHKAQGVNIERYALNQDGSRA